MGSSPTKEMYCRSILGNKRGKMVPTDWNGFSPIFGTVLGSGTPPGSGIRTLSHEAALAIDMSAFYATTAAIQKIKKQKQKAKAT